MSSSSAPSVKKTSWLVKASRIVQRKVVGGLEEIFYQYGLIVAKYDKHAIVF